MKLEPVVFSEHSGAQLLDGGTTREEVEAAIAHGEQIPAKYGRVAFRKNFPFESSWKGRYYETKQVLSIVVQDEGK
ncbi:MAG: hypothetical protein HY671_10910 [Chloroflexi bacterium]|nr:hypothetical protein [Chloroflexota bacterium]